MSRKYLLHKSLLLLVVSISHAERFFQYLQHLDQQNFQLLIDFTCATAKDELEKHPEMRTIAMVELENNFPSDFSREVLKCLPEDVAKIIINPHDNILTLPKQTMVIYVADNLDQLPKDWSQKLDPQMQSQTVIRCIHHLSKHLILSSESKTNNGTASVLEKLLNVVQIYEVNRKVIARSFDMTGNLPTFETFESSQRENLSQILFPDKTKNLNGQPIYAVYTNDYSALNYAGSVEPNNKWIPYLHIVVEKLNATLILFETSETETNSVFKWINKLNNESKLDFYLNLMFRKNDLESYNRMDFCFTAPLPPKYSIAKLILFLPMDKFCWMWLGITIAVSTLIWRISEGHWNFVFGAYSYFMGQAQLIIRIRTNRLTMKILLQFLIFAIFIFSNGYQSLVTSFMLNPVEVKLFRTVDEVLESDVNISFVTKFERRMQDNPSYQKAKKDGRVIKVSITQENNKFAAHYPCNFDNYRLPSERSRKDFNGIYMIHDVTFSEIVDLYTRPFHPYIENFQELMDRSLEAGLHQAWERFFWEKWLDIYIKDMQDVSKRDEVAEILDFDLIAPSFYILAFGFGAAVVGFMFEIFYRDFVSKISKEYLKRKWNEIFGRRNERPTRRVNRVRVNKIRVKPAVKVDS